MLTHSFKVEARQDNCNPVYLSRGAGSFVCILCNQGLVLELYKGDVEVMITWMVVRPQLQCWKGSEELALQAI